MKSDLSTYASIMTTKKNVRKNPEYNATGEVTKITIHHMAGNLGANQCAVMHATSRYQQSANYYIGSDGAIVCGVDEEFRAWTSGSKLNDYKAITIEVANCTLNPTWKISEAAQESLVKLCTDICKRYNIVPYFNGTKNATFTFHYMFQATECPGPFIKNNIGKIIEYIQASLNGSEPAPEPVKDSFLVKVTADCLNIRSGPGTNYEKVGEITDHGVYTIVETSGNWGKLKSGAGWICLRYTKGVK